MLLVVNDGGDLVRLLDDLLIFGMSAYAAVCCGLAAKSAQDRMRTAWTVLTVAMAAWAVADLIWFLSEYVLHTEPFPSPADVFYLIFSVLAVPALLMMGPFHASSWRYTTVRIVLDGVTVALCVFLLAWIFALRSVYAAYEDDRLGLALALFYPVADIVLLAIAVAVWVRADPRQRTVLGLLVLAFAVMTVTDSAFAHQVAEGTYATGNPIDIGWAVSLAAISAAAVLIRRTPPPRMQALSVPSASALWAPYVPLLLAGTIGPAVVMTGLERVIVPVVVTAVCLRQSVAAFENRRWAKAAADQALKDPLTELANEALFFDRLAHAMVLRAREGRPVTVAALDLEDFAFVNDNLGHPAGDKLLVHAGRRIAACLRPGDTVGRLGGDEFVLLLEGDLDDSRHVLRCVLATFDEPFTVDGQPVSMRCRVGVAVVPPGETDVTPETLVQRADIAVQAAKRSHTSRVCTFDADMTPDHGEIGDPDARDTDRVTLAGAAKVRLLAELRRAVDHGDFDLAYQPKVDLRGGGIVGVEALLRWPHPEMGELQPGTFMPLVRQHNMIRPVTDLVVEKVLDDTARWLAAGVRMPVAVNMFAPSLRDTRLPAALSRALDLRSLPADMLTVEITEDLVINDLSLVVGVLQQLREHGIRVAIDDFGSGYSALSYLRDLRIDEIKLDRSFIAAVTTDHRAATVVRAVIDLTHALGMTVVAEGIEEVATAEWLRDSGCDVGQGYHFGKPSSPGDIPQLVTLAAQSS
ncbi:GGDEF-domain containing protein [Mycolicibacterium duvalii]|nr:EAL domain-containing protein [Mycolicibacterium duvalii]PEG36768.1 GGDEF-domain containing protein [Mycolicibacterium duvalii]